MATKLSDIEALVLGAVMETQFLATQHYPVKLDYLLQVCATKTHSAATGLTDRNTLKAVLDGLVAQGLIRELPGKLFQSPRYAHRFGVVERAYIELTRPELALLSVLMIEGPLGCNQLYERARGLYQFRSITEVATTLNQMLNTSATPLVRLLPFDPKHPEPCYTHLFDEVVARESEHATPSEKAASAPVLERIGHLEQENEQLRMLCKRMQQQIDILFAHSPTVSNKYIL